MNINLILKQIETLASSKDISKSVIIDSIVTGLEKAYIKNYGYDNVEVSFDDETNTMNMVSIKEVVENDDSLDNDVTQITLQEAQSSHPNVQVGETIERVVTLEELGRIAISTAKQIIIQRIREEERSQIIQEFDSKVNELIYGQVTNIDEDKVTLNFGKVEAYLLRRELIPGEELELYKKYPVLLTKILSNSKGIKLFITRKAPRFIECLLEKEIPEIFDGTVEIINVAREAGKRCKIALLSHDKYVDAIGSVIGNANGRLSAIENELNGEKIDAIYYSDIPELFIRNSMSPARVKEVIVNEQEHESLAIVPDSYLTAAIGLKGINVRLAANLTNWKIDIKTETEAKELGLA